jgi:hypothetical protein
MLDSLTNGSLEVTLGESSTRDGLQKAFEPNRRILGSKLHGYHEGPWSESSCVRRLACVVRGQSGG